MRPTARVCSPSAVVRYHICTTHVMRFSVAAAVLGAATAARA
jgi:hypothetical protein